MAGGHSIWFSKDAKSDPRAIFNWKLWYLVITVGFNLASLDNVTNSLAGRLGRMFLRLRLW